MKIVRPAFSLPELLVVLGVIALLLAILLPVLSRAREASLTTLCRSQLHGLGQTMAAYASDNRGELYPRDQLRNRPGEKADDWRMGSSRLYEMTGGMDPLVCPTGAGDEWLSYIINGWTGFGRVRLGQSRQTPPSDIIVVGENRPRMNDDMSGLDLTPPVILLRDATRHGERLKSNLLWLDMHVDNAEKNVTGELDPWYVP